MQIANPIYDVVFKYLMEDNDIAKLLISTIIGEEIVELAFLPQETTVSLEAHSLTVYRLDFSATIKKPDGSYRHVIIEIQKAKLATDIMRFRRYLGDQYQKKDNAYFETVRGKQIRKAMPIVSIYFIGYQLDKITAPVIKVNRNYYDVTTGEEILEREDFIESLTHDSYVIQIPHLKSDHRTDIEELLRIFDQNQVTSDSHILSIDEANYPEKYRLVIRHLQRALVEPHVKRTMDAEDDILAELQDLEREIERKDKALKDSYRIIEDKDKALEDSYRIIEELRKRLQTKD